MVTKFILNQLAILFIITGSSSAKRRLRIERNKILRNNRHDPQLEEAARLNQCNKLLDVGVVNFVCPSHSNDSTRCSAL